LLLFHAADHLAALVGEAAFADAVRRAADVVVEEMSRRHHAHARVVQAVKVIEIAVKRVRAFDAQEAGGELRLPNAPVEVSRQLRRRADERELAARTVGGLLKLTGLIER